MMSEGSPRHFKQTISSKVDEIKAKAEDCDSYTLPHPVWSKEENESVEVNHREPGGVADRCAYYLVMLMRTGFDVFSGYTFKHQFGTIDEKACLTRCIFLETVAG